ncbi:DUF1554 domain-containing protein [Candidatus Daviesbacteria bacterium]|nr:DUF1554 domain-containing protein [Candidatus Daviesbacteria bacterium]
MSKKSQSINNQNGAVPLLLLIAFVGLIIFLIITNTFSFKDAIFRVLFPKPTSNAAMSDTIRVFVTSNNYTGNLGGVAGADAKCQESAQAANLKGVWRAWISDSSTTSPSSRFDKDDGPYVLIDGTKIADSWLDLTDGSLFNPINITELNTLKTLPTIPGSEGKYVWTNTSTSGGVYSTDTQQNCNNWSSAGEFIGGAGGHYNDRTNWTTGTGATCVVPEALYCFEHAVPLPSVKPSPSPTPEPDSDKDGFLDKVEKVIGTDPLDDCSDKSNDDAWPPDINNNRKVNTNDYSSVNNHIRRKKSYNRRFDMNGDGKLDGSDLAIINKYIGKSCTN